MGITPRRREQNRRIGSALHRIIVQKKTPMQLYAVPDKFMDKSKILSDRASGVAVAHHQCGREDQSGDNLRCDDDIDCSRQIAPTKPTDRCPARCVSSMLLKANIARAVPLITRTGMPDSSNSRCSRNDSRAAAKFSVTSRQANSPYLVRCFPRHIQLRSLKPVIEQT